MNPKQPLPDVPVANVVRFVGGPMHCHLVPDFINGMVMVIVNCHQDGNPVQAHYSLGVMDLDSGERVVFYGHDDIEDFDELERLVLQVVHPC